MIKPQRSLKIVNHEFLTLGFANKHVTLDDNEDQKIKEIVEDFIDEVQVEIPPEDRLPSSGKVRKITSFTGDDQAIAGTNRYVTAIQIAIARFFFPDIISIHDTAINNTLGNYTEGYIMFAPHKDSTFPTVARCFSGEGFPLTFDTMKLKQFLPNRKGKFASADLSDKLDQAVKQIEYMNDGWVGKPFGGLMHLIMLSAMNFRESRLFPFLYKTEGGCGGRPPFNNLGTFKSVLHYYKGGRARNGILKIMSETADIQNGLLAPKDGTVSQAMHLAQTGMGLGKISNFFRDPDFKILTPEEKEELLSGLADKTPIPDDLKRKSVLIEPENKFVGAIVAELRKSGFVMTELDIRMLILGRKKFEALLGDRNMGEVSRELEAEKEKEKALPLQVLVSSQIDAAVEQADPDVVAMNYFTSASNRADITGLSYAARLRVFKSADVLQELRINSFGIDDDVIRSMQATNDFSSSQKYGYEEIRHNAQYKSLKGDLAEILNSPDPGVGPDDARIGLTALKLAEKVKLTGIKDTVHVLVTRDRDLINYSKVLYPSTFNIGIHDYKSLMNRSNKPEVEHRVEKPYITLRTPADFGNTPHRKRYTSIELERFYNNGHKRAHISYDFNNINRHLESLTKAKGFFTLKEVKTNGYGLMEWEELCDQPQFARAPRSGFGGGFAGRSRNRRG